MESRRLPNVQRHPRRSRYPVAFHWQCYRECRGSGRPLNAPLDWFPADCEGYCRHVVRVATVDAFARCDTRGEALLAATDGMHFLATVAAPASPEYYVSSNRTECLAGLRVGVWAGTKLSCCLQDVVPRSNRGDAAGRDVDIPCCLFKMHGPRAESQRRRDARRGYSEGDRTRGADEVRRSRGRVHCMVWPHGPRGPNRSDAAARDVDIPRAAERAGVDEDR